VIITLRAISRLATIILIYTTWPALAAPPDPELEAWLEDDAEFRIDEVNSGELVFLPTPPKKRALHHQNNIGINPDSITSGWVTLNQCFEHLDAVPSTQIVYNPDRIRNLTVKSLRNIEKAWIEGPSVQLANVGKEARICISATSKAFWRSKDGSFVLRNGPFMRRFLDGYYPLRLTMEVRYPNGLLSFNTIQPLPQKGFKITHERGRIAFDTWFEGELRTEIHFTQKP